MTQNIIADIDDLPETSLDLPTEQAETSAEPIEPEYPTLADYLPTFYEQMGTQGEGLKTYFPEFDEKLEGLRGIVVLGGEPGSGKTALAMQIGYETADQDERPVLIYSFEMPKAQLVTRMFQRAGKITYKFLQKRYDDPVLANQEGFRKAQARIGRMADRIIIRDIKDFLEEKDNGAVGPRFDFNNETSLINQLTEQYGKTPLIIIDSLHEIPVDDKHLRSADLKHKIDHIMLNLRFMCDITGATFLLISHQSRSGQESGGLRSFMGSASIEYTVDQALTVNTKDQEGKDMEEGARVLVVSKNRYGPKPKAMLDFDGQYMDFTFFNVL